MEESLLKSIADVGISGAVTFFLLFRFSRSVDGLTVAINDLIKQNAVEREQIKRYIAEEVVKMKGVPEK